MPRTVLKNLGLSDNESKVYLVTLSLGSAANSVIARKCGLKRSSAYTVIEKLKKNGFLTSYTKNKINYFSAIDPEFLLMKCKNKAHEVNSTVRRMEEILPILNNMSDVGDKVEVKYFEGLEGVKAMLEDAISVESDIDAIVQTENFSEEILNYLTKAYLPKRKLLATKDSKTIVVEKEKSKKYMEGHIKKVNGKIKTIPPQKIDIKISIQLYENKVAIYSFKENELSGIIIKNNELYQTLRGMFNFIWAAI